MDLAYLHLITNHIPIIGVPFALFLLVLGLWRKSDELKTAALLIFVFLGIATLATFLLGQGGEDFVEDLAGVSESAIHEHEDFAKFALATVILTAIFSLFVILRYQGFAFLRKRITAHNKLIEGEVSSVSASYFPIWAILAVTVLALISSAVLGYTGKLGGKIRHLEFYGGVTQNNEEMSGKNRRDKTEENVQPKTETQTTNEQNSEEKDEESGKGRGRNRGKK